MNSPGLPLIRKGHVGVRDVKYIVPAVIVCLGLPLSLSGAETAVSDSVPAARAEVMSSPISGDEEGAAVAEDDENIKITNLQELVVENDKMYFEDGKLVGIPSRSDRNLATDPASLIRNMRMPGLHVVDGEVQDQTGRGVSYFINYRPATPEEISTFWSQDVIRVEYVSDSEDPRFMGQFPAVNLIMKVYEAGGIVRADGGVEMPGSGVAVLGAKLVYRRMTWLATVKGEYTRDHLSRDTEREEYRDIWYDGTLYDMVSRVSETRGNATRGNNAGASVNGIYENGGFRASHTAGVSWNENPGSEGESVLTLDPRLFDGSSSYSRSDSRSLTPYVNGDYQWTIDNSRMATSFGWAYTHGSNRTGSVYGVDGMPAIWNTARETSDGLRMNFHFGAIIGKETGKKTVLMFSPTTSYTWYRTDYGGSYAGRQTLGQGTTVLEGTVKYPMSDKLYLSLTGGATATYWRVNSEDSYTQWSPIAEGNVYLTLSPKNRLSLLAMYHHQPAGASTANDALVRRTELMWVRGTPDLKGLDSYMVSLQDIWIPGNWLYVWGELTATIDRNTLTPVFDISAGYDGVVRQSVSGGNTVKYRARLRSSFNLFGGALSIDPEVTFYAFRSSGIYSRRLDYLHPRVYLRFRHGNWMVYGEYMPPFKDLSDGGASVVRTDHRMTLSVSWGTPHWLVSAGVSDFWHKRGSTTTVIDTPHYKSVVEGLGIGRQFSLSATYTFGYGKRVSPDINLGVEEAGESSILK